MLFPLTLHTALLLDANGVKSTSLYFRRKNLTAKFKKNFILQLILHVSAVVYFFARRLFALCAPRAARIATKKPES